MTRTPQRLAAEQKLRLFVGAIIVLGAVTVLSGLNGLTHGTVPPWWRLTLAGSACALGDVALLHLRFGHDQHSFTWSEIAVIVGMVLIPSPWLRLVGAGSVALAQVMTRRSPVKIAFNSLSFATGTMLARAVVNVTGTPLDHLGVSRPSTWAVLAVASLVFFMWNTATVSCAVGFSQGVSPFGVMRKGLILSGIVWIGNTATAILLVVVVSGSPSLLVVLPVLLGVLFLVYRAYLSAMQQRDVWQVLQAASRHLQQVQQADIANVVLDRLPALLGAEFVELLVVHPERSASVLYRWSSIGGGARFEGDPDQIAASYWPRLQSEAETFSVAAGSAPTRQAAELRDMGLAMCLVAPLIAHDQCIGGIRIGFRGRITMRASEVLVLTTFANHVSSALHNARLFEQIGNERSEFDRIVTHSSDGILSIDARGRVRRWNPAMERLTGVRANSAVGRPLFHGLVVTNDDGSLLPEGWLCDRVAKADQMIMSVRLETLAGEDRWIELSASRTSGDHDDELAVVVVHDITERKRFESQLTYQAQHDPLTGLPNRTLLSDRLSMSLERARRDRQSVAVLFVDLDRFKVINDSLGHEAGDEVIIAAGERIARGLRSGDTAARFGGDEFVVLCERVSGEAEALAIAERVANTLAEPFQLANDRVFLTVSIGVAVSRARDEEPVALLRDADAAMYLAKERGRSRVQLFTADMRDRAVARLETENHLREAIEHGELRLYFQPYVTLDDEFHVTGAEALVRWHHPERGVIFPGEFIQLAEETGLVQPLGHWVLSEACRVLTESAGADGAGPGRCLSINVSAHQLAHDQFVGRVASALRQWDVDPSRLCLEITETALIDDMNAALSRLHELKSLGVKLALDDFGTGYSALSHLRLLPVDIVKIDRSFIARMDENARDRAIVSGMIELGHALGLTVIAEGVEVPGQALLLRELGCDLAQGYLFAPPSAAPNLTAMLSSSMLPPIRALQPRRPRLVVPLS